MNANANDYLLAVQRAELIEAQCPHTPVFTSIKEARRSWREHAGHECAWHRAAVSYLTLNGEITSELRSAGMR